MAPIDFRIATAPLATPDRAHWRELIPHRPGVYILVDRRSIAGHLVRLERANALPSIVIRDLATGAEHTIAFDEAAYSLDMQSGYEFDTTTLRFSYSSMTTPAEVYDYDMASARSGPCASARRSRRATIRPTTSRTPHRSRRRTTAPRCRSRCCIAATSRLDGTAPLLLYGYGSYGMAMPASFSANRLSLVDRGFVYAIAHIRGGAEKGWGWYLDGKREKKTNTFDDFVACRPRADRREATPRPAASSAMAAAPAAC